MSKEEPTHADLAEDCMKQARTLAGEPVMSDREFVESMSRMDSLLDHDPESCGQCGHQFMMAEVAREMLASGDFRDAIRRWSNESTRRWQAGKYFQLYQSCRREGRDPAAVFAEKGWEM